MHATENPPEEAQPALVAVVVKAMDDEVCDGLACGAPAVVAITLGAYGHPLLRCAVHWPPLEEMLNRRGHEVVSR